MKNPGSDQLTYITKRPFWNFILALPLYFFTISMIFKAVDLFYLGKIMDALKFVGAVFFMFVCAAGLTFTKEVYTNMNLKTLRFRFTLFKVPLCKDSIFKNVQYVSLYRNHSDRDFEVKIWLYETKKKSISVHFNFETALDYALRIANALDVNLLDATEKGNFRWVEKQKLQ